MAEKKTVEKTQEKKSTVSKNKTNSESTNAECSDKYCPIHSKGVSLRGKSFVGEILSDAFHKTVSVGWERRILIKKYERYERRRTKVKAHLSTCINVKKGDKVKIIESRPLSKTKNFIIVEKVNE